MNDVFSWDFTLANYGAVWAFMVQIGLLLLFLMLGNILRRVIPLFRKCLIPSALLGGTLLLIVNISFKQFGVMAVDNRLMQVITYHCLAIGFAAMSLKTHVLGLPQDRCLVRHQLNTTHGSITPLPPSHLRSALTVHR